MGRRIVVTEEQIAEATRLYLDEGLTMRDIGQIHGRSVHWVKCHLLVGVPLRRSGTRKGTMLATYAEKAERKICPTCGIVTDDGQECDECAGRVGLRIEDEEPELCWAGTFLTMRNEAYLEEASGW